MDARPDPHGPTETQHDPATRPALSRPAEAKEKEIEIVEVVSAEQLDAACREPIVCEFTFKGKVWRIQGRALTPGERDRVDLIIEQALPDVIAPPPGSDGEIRYDLRNPLYLTNKSKYKAQARALALYLAYPIVAENEKVKAVTKPNVKLDLLTDVMQGMFTTDIQQAMWDASIGPSRLWERANFF